MFKKKIVLTDEESMRARKTGYEGLFHMGAVRPQLTNEALPFGALQQPQAAALKVWSPDHQHHHHLGTC